MRRQQKIQKAKTSPAFPICSHFFPLFIHFFSFLCCFLLFVSILMPGFFLFSYSSFCFRFSFRYMEFEHMRHCVSDSKVSGLHSLPLPFVYVDDVIDNSRPTLQTLPTGELLNGSQSYLRLFTFFSKNDVTPEQLRTMGYEKLDELLKQVGKVKSNPRLGYQSVEFRSTDRVMWYIIHIIHILKTAVLTFLED